MRPYMTYLPREARESERGKSCGRNISFQMAVGEFFFTPLVLFIVPKYCHDEFFVNFNFFHGKLSVWLSN